MKKSLWIGFLVSLLMLFCLNTAFASEDSFIAVVVKVHESSVIVKPVPGSPLFLENQTISLDLSKLEKLPIAVGSVVQVTYTETSSASETIQIHAIHWQLVDHPREIKYTGQWLDHPTPSTYNTSPYDSFCITWIYQDCFFAEEEGPNPIVIKINAVLSDEWCIGDRANFLFENYYVDGQRAECDLVSIEPIKEPEPCLKPVIYLYPQAESVISVKLLLEGSLTCTYPAYNDGWKVTAQPDGTLKDAKGQSYNYLYWEGETYAQWDMSKGFCVKGEDTAAFLEEALEKQGLNRREANEFIVYWLPLMERNPYNIISFQTDAYTQAAALQIDPAPDTLIRVFMTWKASDAFVELSEQELTAPERTGFTAVEWGGSEIK